LAEKDFKQVKDEKQNVEEKVHSYPLPDNVALLNRLAEIIK
jgi:hypothetical protein